mgnify:CR=1 FL=1
MRSMIWKSTFREIKESLGRFLAILAIVALGVGFFAGLKVTQPAMLKTAQRYFDKTALYDYRLISTVGFSEDEVETIKKQKDVKAAEGAVTFDIICESGGKERVLKMHSITEDVNRLVLVDGELPENAGECVVDSNLYGASMTRTIWNIFQTASIRSPESCSLLCIRSLSAEVRRLATAG